MKTDIKMMKRQGRNRFHDGETNKMLPLFTDINLSSFSYLYDSQCDSDLTSIQCIKKLGHIKSTFSVTIHVAAIYKYM